MSVQRRTLAGWLGLTLTGPLGVPSLALAAGESGSAKTADAWAALTDGAVLLFRHADAPGVGDPPNLRLGDCSTQRNLGERGREQARAIGQALRQRGVRVASVGASPWCRTRQTAELAFPGQPVADLPEFGSFFNDREQSPAQTAAALAKLRAWRGPGVQVVVSHQVNITALTGVYPASGEGVVLRWQGDGLAVLGRLPPP